MRLLSNARLARIDGKSAYYAVNEPMPLVMRDDRIAWIAAGDTPPDDFAGAVPHDLGGPIVTQGLIDDCYGHIVFGDGRAREFEIQLEGVSYEDIACNGGGRYGIKVVHAWRPRHPDGAGAINASCNGNSTFRL